MKKWIILVIVVIAVVAIITGYFLISNPSDQSNGAETQPNENSEVIELCSSLCQTDAEAYCQELRTISVDGAEVQGTCRAFSRKKRSAFN